MTNGLLVVIELVVLPPLSRALHERTTFGSALRVPTVVFQRLPYKLQAALLLKTYNDPGLDWARREAVYLQQTEWTQRKSHSAHHRLCCQKTRTHSI